MAKRVLLVVANGSEELETVAPFDLLVRAGATVTLAASGDCTEVTLSRGLKVTAEATLVQVAQQEWDLVVVPGGPGAETFAHDHVLIELLKRQKAAGKWFAAICASPAVVLEPHGLLEGLRATCYPAHASKLADQSAIGQRVVVSENCVTSQGAGTALEFSLELVKCLFGQAKAQEQAEALVANSS